MKKKAPKKKMKTSVDTPEQAVRPESGELLTLAVDIVCAYVSNNKIESAELPGLIDRIVGTLQGGSSSVAPSLAGRSIVARAKSDSQGARTPAVPVGKSVFPDYIVCLEDGRKLKMLKRHLNAAYDMSPEEYRQRWNLPPDYPMTAPNYAQKRSRLAREIGLGKKTQERKRAKAAA